MKYISILFTVLAIFSTSTFAQQGQKNMNRTELTKHWCGVEYRGKANRNQRDALHIVAAARLSKSLERGQCRKRGFHISRNKTSA